MKRPPAEMVALARLRQAHRAGKKTSVYLRMSALRKLEKATQEWNLPASIIINTAVDWYLSKAGIK